MCVIVSARIPNPNEDPTLADKEAILASLNIKAMQVYCPLALLEFFNYVQTTFVVDGKA